MSNVAEIYQQLPIELARYTFTNPIATPVLKALHGDSSGVRGAAWLAA
jgi:fructokinase